MLVFLARSHHSTFRSSLLPGVTIFLGILFVVLLKAGAAMVAFACSGGRGVAEAIPVRTDSGML